MNKKGFTIAEVIVSFSLVSVILVSMVGATIYYRDKVKEEEVITQLVDFKNTITNVIYDDILIHNNRKISSIERCIETPNCINFLDKEYAAHTLKIEYNPMGQKKGAYLSYDGKLYMLPDSDLGQDDDRTCDFVGGFDIDYYHDTTNKMDLYTVKTSFEHKDLNKQYTIMVTVNHYNEDGE